MESDGIKRKSLDQSFFFMDIQLALDYVRLAANRTTQPVVAAALEVSESTVNRWINGDSLPTNRLQKERLLAWAQAEAAAHPKDAPPAANQPLAYWDGAAWAAERMSETVTSILREYRIAREAQTALANVTADGKGAVVPGRASAKERKAGDG